MNNYKDWKEDSIRANKKITILKYKEIDHDKLKDLLIYYISKIEVEKERMIKELEKDENYMKH